MTVRKVNKVSRHTLDMFTHRKSGFTLKNESDKEKSDEGSIKNVQHRWRDRKRGWNEKLIKSLSISVLFKINAILSIDFMRI